MFFSSFLSLCFATLKEFFSIWKFNSCSLLFVCSCLGISVTQNLISYINTPLNNSRQIHFKFVNLSHSLVFREKIDPFDCLFEWLKFLNYKFQNQNEIKLLYKLLTLCYDLFNRYFFLWSRNLFYGLFLRCWRWHILFNTFNTIFSFYGLFCSVISLEFRDTRSPRHFILIHILLLLN